MSGGRGGRWLIAVAGTVGAVWGVLSYQILWGNTSIVVTRQYVVSVRGLLTLLPVRVVLYGIGFAEDHVAGHPFDFSNNHAWIGLVAGAVGALLVIIPAKLSQLLFGRRTHSPPRDTPVQADAEG